MTLKQKKALAKKLYILGHSYEEIAQHLGVSTRTIQNYKADDKEWDTLRTNAMLSSGSDKIYTNFLEYMNDFLKEIKEADLKPEERVDKLSQLGDAFAKMKKIAHQEDPAVYKHTLIKQTLTILIEGAREKMSKKCLEQLVGLIESLQEEIADATL